MKDEIKEIIESLLYLCDLPKDVTYSLNKKCIEKVRDYITNLQEENKKFKNWINVLNKDNHNYKSRNEKAIELLKYDMKNFDLGDGYSTCEKSLNILQGEDKE